jgi:AcrR family transcriptional regulator
MSPRGVAITDVREQLFAAAARVLARDGPSGISSRALTTEAGTAKGLLYSHFADLDAFLADFVLDRAQQVTAAVSALPQRAGQGTVIETLTNAALSLAPQASTLIGLAQARPSLAARLRRAGHSHAGGLEEIERTFAAYLDAERKLGRLAADADIQALALALVATVHHLSQTYPAGEPELDRQVTRVVTALIAKETLAG